MVAEKMLAGIRKFGGNVSKTFEQKRATDLRLSQMRILRREKKSFSAIGKQFDLSRQRVHQLLSAAGVSA
jgi:DNA-directed RNA polymerase sigma subunit (sigma70/sigma32)